MAAPRGADPYDEVRGEIVLALEGTEGAPGLKGMFERWKELAEDPAPRQKELDELTWLQEELKNGLRQVEWDIKDVQETIAIVMKQPARFQIDEDELDQRHYFVDMVSAQVDNMRRALERGAQRGGRAPADWAAGGAGGGSRKGGYEQLDASGAQALEATVRREFARQEEQLGEQVAPGLTSLKEMAAGMRQELGEQEGMLVDLDSRIDRAKATMARAYQRLDHLSHNMSNTKKMCCIVVLIIVLLLLIVLTFTM
eukprot:TRINITY_DN52112_c0_g1_i1.p1 TRINITY_DN52112_c0_g1~~TRINITY_DN52112_c0_g1_i1.p1  ORF type:complete len:255 (+),score=69.69 TRINITY_DN52112_c0_g1_i1:113-877(+)